MLKSDRPFFAENSLLSKFEQKIAKNRVFCSFLKMIFLMQNESYFSPWLSIANPMTGKIRLLELSSKMFLTNYTAGFFSVISLEKIKGLI